MAFDLRYCKICNKVISPEDKYEKNYHSRRYCSDECRKKKAHEDYIGRSNPSYRRDKEYPDKYCLYCNTLLVKNAYMHKRKFCNKICENNFNIEKNTKKCSVCGISFYTTFKNQKCCSRKCSSELISLKKSVIKKCDYCGKEIKVHNNKLDRLNHFFCDKKCFNEFKKLNPLNAVDKIDKICTICGKKFKVYPSNEKQSKEKGYDILYCSIECRNKDKKRMTEKSLNMNLLQSNKNGLNKIELIMKNILENLGLIEGIDFYSQHKMFNKFLVDFYLIKENIVIQCDGDYWHGHSSMLKEGIPDKRQEKRMKLDISQDAYMKKCGVTVLRFWEHKLLNNKGEIDAIIRKRISEVA